MPDDLSEELVNGRVIAILEETHFDLLCGPPDADELPYRCFKRGGGGVV